MGLSRRCASIELPSALNRSLKLSAEPFRHSDDCNWTRLDNPSYSLPNALQWHSPCIPLLKSLLRFLQPWYVKPTQQHSYTTKTSKKYYQSSIDDFHLSPLLRPVLNERTKKEVFLTKSEASRIMTKAIYFFVCCAEKKTKSKSGERTHTPVTPGRRNFRSEFLPAECFL